MLTRNEVYDTYLDHSIGKKSDNKFEYNFNQSSDKNSFGDEFEKFLTFTNNFFAQDGILVTVINSYCYVLDTRMLNYIFQLFTWAEKLDDKVYVGYISEYMLTYHFSLRSDLYKQRIPDHQRYQTELDSIFSHRLFYANGSVFSFGFDFYNSILKYTSETKKIVLPEIMKRMLSKFKHTQDEYKLIFDEFLNNGKYISFLVKNDYDIGIHRQYYLGYIDNRLKEPIFSDDTIDVITFVYHNAPFSQELAVAMINHLVISTNKMCENMRIKNIDVISCISSLDDLIGHLRKIKSLNFGVNNKKFGTKMHECILSLFYYKRQLLRDEEYTRRNFKEIPFNITIPKSEKSYREYIEENIMSLYNLVRIDFDKILEGAIKSYSEHPLVYLVTDLNIDSVNGIYSISEEYSSNVFSDYYEKRGIELSKELENNLRNIVGQKYYKTMMKYHSLSFNSSLAIISEVLKEDFIWIKNKFRDLLEFTSPVYDNDYVLLCKNVISIEYYLYKIAEKKSLGQKEDPEKILAELFKQYEGNSEYRNGFQFINFILFDFFGPNLRNKLLHGMELNKSNLSSQSYQIFACVIFLNYFMSLEKLQ